MTRIQSYFGNGIFKLEQLSSKYVHTLFVRKNIGKEVKMSYERWHAYYRCCFCNQEYNKIIVAPNTVSRCDRCTSPNFPYQQVTLKIGSAIFLQFWRLFLYIYLQLYFKNGSNVPYLWGLLCFPMQILQTTHQKIQSNQICKI